METLKRYLQRQKGLIDRELDRLLPKRDTKPVHLHRAMRYSTFSGGKRIRPILAIEACKLCGGRIDEVMTVACAVELVHTFSLIHDDLPSMDNDDYRRGKPSCHIKFGEASAILAGDALLTLAFEALGRTRRSARVQEAVLELSENIGSRGMMGGQEADLKKDAAAKKRELDFITERKTAALFKTALRLGAIFGGAKRREGVALSRFGRFLGLAFQLMDDSFDNDGYMRIMSGKNTKAQAKKFIYRAKNELKIFGKKADRLKKLADFIAG